MRKRNLGIAIICLAALLAGCGQAPVSPVQKSTAPDVRMEAQVTDTTHTEPSTEALQMETETTESQTVPMTEPIREQTSTEQETDRPTAQTQPDEPIPTQAPPKETTQPTQPSAPPTATEPKPTEPPTQAPTEPTTEAPTEPPTEPQAPAIDVAALEAYGNQYAAQLGFQVDYTMTTSNSGYFPPNSAILSSMSDGYRLVSEQVSVTRDYLMAYVGSIEGARCRILVSNDGNGRYTCTVLYG